MRAFPKTIVGAAAFLAGNYLGGRAPKPSMLNPLDRAALPEETLSPSTLHPTPYETPSAVEFYLGVSSEGVESRKEGRSKCAKGHCPLLHRETITTTVPRDHRRGPAYLAGNSSGG